MMDLMGKGAEFSRLDASEELYRFLIMLKNTARRKASTPCPITMNGFDRL